MTNAARPCRTPSVPPFSWFFPASISATGEKRHLPAQGHPGGQLRHGLPLRNAPRAPAASCLRDKSRGGTCQTASPVPRAAAAMAREQHTPGTVRLLPRSQRRTSAPKTSSLVHKICCESSCPVTTVFITAQYPRANRAAEISNSQAIFGEGNGNKS